MTTAAEPKISRRASLPLVWIVPLVALAIGGWMVFREFRQHGPKITIEFVNGSGVEPRKTRLEYQGVTIGTVTDIELKSDLSGVLVQLQLHKNATAIASEGAQFWIVQPEIGFSGVRGLETLLTGARINVRPGKGPPATHFKGLNKSPPVENIEEGRAFLLRGDRLGSLSPGAPVYFREVKVGVVETSRLDDDATGVLVRIRVRQPYVNLIRTNTRFWNAGGVSFKMSLLGAELKSTSLESMFTGGIAFATPDSGRELAPIAPDGTLFTLHGEAEKDWLKWQPRIPINSPEESPDAATPLGALPSIVKQQ
jgi:paraquat-inducible protein B